MKDIACIANCVEINRFTSKFHCYFLTFQKPAFPNANTRREIHLKVVFMYFLNKEICCVLRHAAISSFYFPQNCVYFVVFPALFWVQIILFFSKTTPSNLSIHPGKEKLTHKSNPLRAGVSWDKDQNFRRFVHFYCSGQNIIFLEVCPSVQNVDEA